MLYIENFFLARGLISVPKLCKLLTILLSSKRTAAHNTALAKMYKISLHTCLARVHLLGQI